MKLRILTANDDERAQAMRALAAFEASFRSPFTYDHPAQFAVEARSPGGVAASKIEDGIATLFLTSRFFESPLPRQTLTLFHETLHLASFAGRLRDMYTAVQQFDRTFRGAGLGGDLYDTATLLGQHLFEVDVELAFSEQYPEHVEARNAQYVELAEHGFTNPTYAAASDASRPYHVLIDLLRAELAGVMAGDDRVTEKLTARIIEVPGFVQIATDSEMTALREMLSPLHQDFDHLAEWGATTYQTVVRRVIERF